MLGLGDQPGIKRRIIRFGDHSASFFDQPFHANALLAAWTDAQLLTNHLDSGDVLLRLLEMIAKCLLELLVLGGLCHLRQRLYQLLLRAVKVFELLDVKSFQRIDLHYHTSAGILVVWFDFLLDGKGNSGAASIRLHSVILLA